MNIQITRNTFVAPEISRADIVQKICDTIVSSITDRHDFELQLDGLHLKLFLYAHIDNPTSILGITRNNNYARYLYTRIRSCEMRIAFRKIQEAGYFVSKSHDGWVYMISNKPYFGLQKAEYVDFTAFID